jgi:selenocysteine lyase/cysteine desulfurase
MNVEQLRAETPGCRERVHLNNAGSSLMPDRVLGVIQDHLALESRIGGYEAEAAGQEAIEAAYRDVARLLGAAPSQIAFTENATASYTQALSSIGLGAGDLILTTRNDYVSNQIQFLSLQKRLGVRVVHAPDLPEGGVDPRAVGELIERERPRLVAVTHVPTNSGLVQDVAAVGAVCREHDVLYLVDACQSIGQLPLDVAQIGCDFLSASARKFLRGPRGAGLLYVSERVLERELVPLFLDMRGADWIAADQYRLAPGARRFENWEFAWALVLGTGEAARYALELGLAPIAERVGRLAARLREGLRALDGVRVLDRGRTLSGLVSLTVEGQDPAALLLALRERGVNTSAQIREYAVLDFDDKRVQATLRMSPHYFNTEAEVDLALAALAEIIRESPRPAGVGVP